MLVLSKSSRLNLQKRTRQMPGRVTDWDAFAWAKPLLKPTGLVLARAIAIQPLPGNEPMRSLVAKRPCGDATGLHLRGFGPYLRSCAFSKEIRGR
jgi:hypothetical protein